MEARRVVITGATRGLGRAMASGFINAGHRVFGCGRDSANVAALTSSFPEHDFEVVDVADDGKVRDWATRIVESFGPPDILLNNAAIPNPPVPLWTISAEDFDPVIDVNVKGVVNVIRHFVPAMVSRRQGVIVNFSSGWGRTVDAYAAPYCATKHAIEGLSKAMALELPDGMASIPLNPGIIDTDMLRAAWGDGASSYDSPEKWAERAVPYILALGPGDNGKSLSIR